MFDGLGIFGYIFTPFHLIVMVHNWLLSDKAVGFEISPAVRWIYKEPQPSNSSDWHFNPRGYLEVN